MTGAIGIMLLSFVGLALSFCIYGCFLETSEFDRDGLVVLDDRVFVGEIDLRDVTTRIDSTLSLSGVDAVAHKGNVVKVDRVNDLFFNTRPRLAFWIFMFSILIAVSFASVLPVVALIRSLVIDFSISWVKCIGGALSAIAFLLISMVISLGTEFRLFFKGTLVYVTTDIMESFGVILKDPHVSISILIGLASLGALVSLTGLFLIMIGIERIDANSPVEVLAAKFKRLNESLNVFLFVIAITITGSVVTTSLLREALMECLPIRVHFLLPVEFVYLYGITFTLFLAIVYAPIYAMLRFKGSAIVDQVQLPESEERTGNAIKPHISDSQRDVFLLKSTSIDTARVILSLLGPALAGYLTNMFGL